MTQKNVMTAPAGAGRASFWRRSALVEGALLAIIVVAGAGLRFYRLESVPPGLYTDEAYYALDALDVLAGARPVYFPANNGREPLFIYGLAASLAAFGRTPLAVRLPAAGLGVLQILAAYVLGRVLFGRRVALLMAALAAGSFWAVALSRIGLRATTLPPLAALMLAAAAAGFKLRRRWLIALAGALCGLCFYTYLSARLIPLPLIGFGVFWYSARRLRGEKPGGPAAALAWDLSAFVLPAAVVAAPLALYALREPQIYLGRIEQVAVFGGGTPNGWSALLGNLAAVAGMFLGPGDLNARHNLPGRPVFDPVLGVAFYAGVVLAFQRVWKRGDGASALVLLWTGTMLAPTVFSQDAPHFLRAIGALPLVFAFPALAFEAAWKWAAARQGVYRGPALALALAIGTLASVAQAARTAYDYFGVYGRDANTALYFQAATVDLAQAVNAYALNNPGRPVYLDRRLWDFPAVRFLLQPEAAVQVVETAAPPAPADQLGGLAVIWPHAGDPWPLAQGLLSGPALITVDVGALYRNDHEPAAYPLAVTYTAQALPEPTPTPMGEFASADGGGIILQAADVYGDGRNVRIRLTWSAAAPPADDLHVFVHLREGETVVAQSDGPLGGEWYPARAWRPGDWTRHTETFQSPAGPATGTRLVVGLYHYPAGDRLTVAATGQDTLELPWPGP